jgi:hypothetical protein
LCCSDSDSSALARWLRSSGWLSLALAVLAVPDGGLVLGGAQPELLVGDHGAEGQAVAEAPRAVEAERAAQPIAAGDLAAGVVDAHLAGIGVAPQQVDGQRAFAAVLAGRHHRLDLEAGLVVQQQHGALQRAVADDLAARQAGVEEDLCACGLGVGGGHLGRAEHAFDDLDAQHAALDLLRRDEGAHEGIALLAVDGDHLLRQRVHAGQREALAGHGAEPLQQRLARQLAVAAEFHAGELDGRSAGGSGCRGSGRWGGQSGRAVGQRFGRHRALQLDAALGQRAGVGDAQAEAEAEQGRDEAVRAMRSLHGSSCSLEARGQRSAAGERPRRLTPPSTT